MKQNGTARKDPCLRHELGISLLEVVVVLAILAILGGYTMPSYHQHQQRGYRLAAITAVYAAAFYLESQQEQTQSPVHTLPAHLARAPAQGKPAYTLSVQTGSMRNGGYSIIARPLENGPMRRDICGRYQLDATGQRSNGSALETIHTLCWLG